MREIAVKPFPVVLPTCVCVGVRDLSSQNLVELFRVEAFSCLLEEELTMRPVVVVPLVMSVASVAEFQIV